MEAELVLENGHGKNQYQAVGKRPIRHDGVDKVTGRALYGADLMFPGMLYGAVLRSPHAHAVIKSIDTREAERHPAVKAVASSRDLALGSENLAEVGEGVVTSTRYLSNNVLAADKVLYKGHAVAAIAADSPHVAEEMLSLIKVEYEALPPVTDVESAMQEGATILHNQLVAPSYGEEAPQQSNVASHQQFKLGDVEEGFRQADLIREREYRTSTVHQGYIEPQNGTASWSHDGHLTVWCSSQGHFGIRDNTAKVLGLEVSRVTVVPMEIGGGFGGKLPTYLEPIAAVLSKKSGRPVKMTMTRAEVLEATGPASGTYVKAKIGVKLDGRITAAQAYLAYEAGAYPGAPIGGAAACMFSPYDIPHVLIDGYDVVTNKPRTAAYRAPGAPMAAFACETLVDELAVELGIDPIEFRRKNAAREGTRRADGARHLRIGFLEMLEAMQAHPHYSAPLLDENSGRGIATGFWRNNTGPSSAVAHVMADGSISLLEGSVDIGGTRTAIAQQFAEVMGIATEDVHPRVVDTDSIGYTSVTGGSGVTFKTGLAAYEAAWDVIHQLKERAALLWETESSEVEYVAGSLCHKFDDTLQISFKDLAAKLNELGGPIVGRASVNPRGVGASFSAMIVDVGVDPETGKVQILRCTAFQDAGIAIHPAYVEGQIQGGSVQGIGWALNEGYVMSPEGNLLNASLLDYRMPTSLDVPMIDAVIVEVPNPGHPFGVRGIGEASIVPPLAAVANAIHGATGVRLRDLPMSPGRVLEGIWKHEGKV